MKYLFLFLLTSCGTSRYYRIESTKMCPIDYVYNRKDDLCHYHKPPAPQFKDISLNPVQSKPKPKKRLKTDSEAESCVKALSKIRQCGVFI